jgi:hypothetical protein
MRPSISRSLVVFALLAGTSALQSQSNRAEDDADWLDRCRRSGWGDDARGRACEVRNVPVHLSGRFISIDGRQNGGIRVTGWSGDSVKVTARLQAQERSDAEASAILSRIHVAADGRSIRADGPSMEEDGAGWSVSYIVFVPRRFDLDLEGHNGGIGVSGVSGKLELRTTNGSLAVTDAGGDVHAETQNGSLNVQLAGSKWDGAGLEARTQNGSVRLAVPDPYSAQLEIGTVNGSIRTDIPVTVQGHLSRQLSFSLGGGGPKVSATTTNGSVTITRR